MITDKYMKGLWEYIEYLSERFEETDDRRYRIMLEACTNRYDSLMKQKIQNDDSD